MKSELEVKLLNEMNTICAKYSELQLVPTTGKHILSGLEVQKYFGVDSVYLYSPPFPSIAHIARLENWSLERVTELQIDYSLNFLVADFGAGSEEGLLLDCSTAEPFIRILRLKNIERLSWECPVVFGSLLDFDDHILKQSLVKKEE